MMTEIPAVQPNDPETLRAYAEWLRSKAAETEFDMYRWMMDSLAEEIEHAARRD